MIEESRIQKIIDHYTDVITFKKENINNGNHISDRTLIEEKTKIVVLEDVIVVLKTLLINKVESQLEEGE